MTQEKFKDLIEAPAKSADVSAYFGNVRQVFLRGLIGRTVRLTLQYPELAQEYLDNRPKAVCENIQPSTEEK